MTQNLLKSNVLDINEVVNDSIASVSRETGLPVRSIKIEDLAILNKKEFDHLNDKLDFILSRTRDKSSLVRDISSNNKYGEMTAKHIVQKVKFGVYPENKSNLLSSEEVKTKHRNLSIFIMTNIYKDKYELVGFTSGNKNLWLACSHEDNNGMYCATTSGVRTKISFSSLEDIGAERLDLQPNELLSLCKKDLYGCTPTDSKNVGLYLAMVSRPQIRKRDFFDKIDEKLAYLSGPSVGQKVRIEETLKI